MRISTKERNDAVMKSVGLYHGAHYNVAPRYSGGSPALVSYATALHVASQEQDEHRACLGGVYGTALKEKAVKLGLEGIVEARREIKNGWVVFDMLTLEEFVRRADGKPPADKADVFLKAKTRLTSTINYISKIDLKGLDNSDRDEIEDAVTNLKDILESLS